MSSTRMGVEKLTLPALLLLTQMEFFVCGALLLQCPLHQLHMQKIVGFRPPLEYLSDYHLIYTPKDNFKDRNRIDRAAAEDESLSTASGVCWRRCQDDSDCIAYVHLLDTDECFGYSFFQHSPRLRFVGHEMPLVADPEAVFYEKTCLKVPETCKSRRWTLTKIPGMSLMLQGRRTISTLVTRRECAERCLFETDFDCLSASFAPSFRNNRERFGSQTPSPPQYTLGRCRLHDRDKMRQPDAFRAAPYEEEYIENQCHERPTENVHCSYELYANSSFLYAEVRYAGLSQNQCQTQCSHETRFFCQGVSFHYEPSLRQSECLLHSEDIVSMGPRSLKRRTNSVYLRRVKCLDVQVLCTHDEMAIKYTPQDLFHGRMYASGHSKDCVAVGNGAQSTLLRLAIGSEPKEHRCGVLRAYEVTRTQHRIFISALLVIQNNAKVQTQGDRLIKVGCIVSNATATDVQDGEDIQDTEEPTAVALESSLAFAQQMLPSEGALHMNTSTESLPFPPKITLQIIDLSQQQETNEVQIGQNLELQILAEYSATQRQLLGPDLPPLPDFRATSLHAKTQDNQNYVLLIDARGCPTDVSVFPALERLHLSNRSLLRARFHAFKFAGTSLVHFDVKIHFCAQRCPVENCLQNGGMRRRRQVALPDHFQVQNPVYISTVQDVVDPSGLTNGTDADPRPWRNLTQLASLNEVPLNFNLRVHGPDMTNSKSFIYGERGILLIAGIDDQLHLDQVCLNQSLLVALFIFWLILQVAVLFSCCFVLQKYKRLGRLEEQRRKMQENLEYLEERRVHWADQGGYTL